MTSRRIASTPSSRRPSRTAAAASGRSTRGRPRPARRRRTRRPSVSARTPGPRGRTGRRRRTGGRARGTRGAGRGPGSCRTVTAPRARPARDRDARPSAPASAVERRPPEARRPVTYVGDERGRCRRRRAGLRTVRAREAPSSTSRDTGRAPASGGSRRGRHRRRHRASPGSTALSGAQTRTASPRPPPRRRRILSRSSRPCRRSRRCGRPARARRRCRRVAMQPRRGRVGDEDVWRRRGRSSQQVMREPASRARPSARRPGPRARRGGRRCAIARAVPNCPPARVPDGAVDEDAERLTVGRSPAQAGSRPPPGARQAARPTSTSCPWSIVASATIARPRRASQRRSRRRPRSSSPTPCTRPAAVDRPAAALADGRARTLP